MRRFLVARRAGDHVAMRREWEELLILMFDRIDGLVYANHQGRLAEDEHEGAVQLALIRLSERLIHSFNGTSMGELVNATRTLCGFIAMDVQAKAARDRKRRRSLDEGWDAGGEDARAPSWEVDQAFENFEGEQAVAAADEFLAWALPQLKASRREVMAGRTSVCTLGSPVAVRGHERPACHGRRTLASGAGCRGRTV